MAKNLKDRTMAKLLCTECGYEFDDHLDACPECGNPASECKPVNQGNPAPANQGNPTSQSNPTTVKKPTQSKNISDSVVLCDFKADWAQYIYECGALYWKTFSTKYADFSGRATRREYWSFSLISLWLAATSGGLLILIILIPWLAVSVRRMHDINRSGWWILVPWVPIFFQFKKSDPGVNEYGEPSQIII